MLAKLKVLFKKYQEVVIYLVFGVLTTVVDFVIYWPLFHLLHWPAAASNAIAWVTAVIFAFVTNKPLVFQSNDWHAKTLLPEIWKFIGCRIASFLFAEAFLVITVDWLQWHGLLMKALVSVVVVIINYVGSKLLVFRKKQRE